MQRRTAEVGAPLRVESPHVHVGGDGPPEPEGSEPPGRRLPIRNKVAASLAVPLLALVVVSFFEVRQASEEVASVRRETDLATALSGPAGVISRLQDERNWAVIELTGLDESFSAGITVEGYEETRGGTDDAVEAFREDVRSKGGAVETTFRDAVAALDELAQIRDEIDGSQAPRTLDNMPFSTGIYGRYSALIGDLAAANSRVIGQVEDTDLRKATELVVLASEQFEREAELNRELAVAATLSPGGLDTREEIRTVSSALAAFNRTNHLFETTTGRYGDVVRERNPADYVDTLNTLIQDTIASHTIPDFDAYMEIIARPPEIGYRGLRDAMLDEVVARAEVLDADAVSRQRIFLILAVVALAVAMTVVVLVSRSITVPMVRMTRYAQELAQKRLPEAVRHILDTPPGEDVRMVTMAPLEATTRDEIADVVKVLNTVQESALELATEQAVMRRNVSDSFVNLARRNQALLSRQIEFITEMESRETHPEALDGLFRLDHLATRMRRNAESLLVLAGTAPPRRLSAPARIEDVVRAALGEVEDFQRVRMEQVVPAMVVGPVAADLGHLLAELVENALSYSSPQEEVVVLGGWRGRDTYRLTVVDQGLGMSPPEVAQANVRLAGAEALTVAPSKYLGQHVAGTLATRHGIRVRLEPGAFRGIVATVDLPASVVETPQAGAVSTVPASGWAAGPTSGSTPAVALTPSPAWRLT